MTPRAHDLGQRLDRVLADALPQHSRSRLKGLIEAGHVSRGVTADTVTAGHGGATISDPSHRVKPGELFAVAVPAPAPATPAAQTMDLEILYEDAALIVIDKPAGLVVHPAPGNPDRTLVNALIAHCGPSLTGIGGVGRPGIVHRLDKDTSGVMVAAKTAAAHASLTAQFAARSIERAYHAFAWGLPPVAEIAGPIGRDPRNRKKMAVVARGGRAALTRLRPLTIFRWRGQPVTSRLEVRLATGRTHQIRVHLAHIGHPVIGDPLYGRARAARRGVGPGLLSEINAVCGRQALHAVTLAFDHPVTGRRCRFEAPLPADLRMLEAVLTELSDSDGLRPPGS